MKNISARTGGSPFCRSTAGFRLFFTGRFWQNISPDFSLLIISIWSGQTTKNEDRPFKSSTRSANGSAEPYVILRSSELASIAESVMGAIRRWLESVVSSLIGRRHTFGRSLDRTSHWSVKLPDPIRVRFGVEPLQDKV